MKYHVVALSGGKDSTAMALRLQEVEPREYIYACTPTGDELPDLLEHWDRLEGLLGASIQRITAKHTLNELIQEWQAIPNGRMRWCTRVLKIEPFQAFVARLAEKGQVTAYVGLRADEPTREGSVYSLPVKQRFPLREWGWAVGDVWSYLDEKDVRIPKRTDCGRCFFQRLGEWWETWRNHPQIYADAERQEEMTGHTFRRANRDTWPTGLKELRERFESGDVPKIRKHPQDVPIQDAFDFDGNQCRACSL